jgi:hypothetical protein
MVSIFGNEINFQEIQLVIFLVSMLWLGAAFVGNPALNAFEVLDRRWAGVSGCDTDLGGGFKFCVAPPLSSVVKDADSIAISFQKVSSGSYSNAADAASAWATLLFGTLGTFIAVLRYLVVLNVFWFLAFQLLLPWYSMWVNPGIGSNL